MAKPLLIPLFKVTMNDFLIEEIDQTLYSGIVTQGPKVEEFEDKLRYWIGNHHTVTTNSGTSAISLALKLIGVGPGDEVISTPLTCFATNAPILNTGASIVWSDVELDTCNIDIDDIERKITDKTKAIMVVHWGGNPCDLTKLREVAGDIPVIEDCAHAFGATYKGNPIGASGNYCAFSFQAIKVLTTIDGGCLVTPKEQYERAKLLRWYGMSRESSSERDLRCEQDVVEPGTKWHMNDINATIGISNLETVSESILKATRNAIYYQEQLQGVEGLVLQRFNPESSHWLFTIRVLNREDFIRKMKDNRIQVSKVHERNDLYTCTTPYRKELPNLDLLSEEMVCIPVGWWVSHSQREYIVNCIKEGW